MLFEERGQPGAADLPPRQRGTDPSGPETEAEKDGRKAPPVLAGIRAHRYIVIRRERKKKRQKNKEDTKI